MYKIQFTLEPRKYELEDFGDYFVLDTNFDIQFNVLRSLRGVDEVNSSGRYNAVIVPGKLFDKEDVYNRVKTWLEDQVKLSYSITYPHGTFSGISTTWTVGHSFFGK